MQCFVINLARETDRLAFMTRQLQSMNIPFTRFDAVDVSSFSAEKKESVYDAEFVRKQYGKDFTNGELGCALSHRAIYEKMVESNIEECLILEDDICFDCEAFASLYRRVSEDKNWEYLSLNYDIFDAKFRTYFHSRFSWKTPVKKFFGLLAMYSYIPLEWIEQGLGRMFGPKILRQIRPLHLCGVYFVRLSAAKKLLSISQKIQHPADYLQSQARMHKGLRTHLVVPQIVRQNNEVFGSSTRS